MKLRGHHLLCIQGFRGYGYSPAFIANMRRLVDQLQDGPSSEIVPVEAIGAICEPCPHRRQLVCGRDVEAEARMAGRDRRVLEKLGFRPGSPVAWGEVLERVGTSVEPGDLVEVCAGCEWLPLGYCQEGVHRLKAGWEPGESVSAARKTGAAPIEL